MTGNVLLCPAMSFYVLIKVKKIGICLYLWSLFRIFTSESFTVRAPLVGALLTLTWMYSGTHKGCPYRKPYIKHHKSKMFIPRIYGKAELALLYQPLSKPETAWKTLYRWINGCPPLMEELKSMNYNPKRRTFLRPEVEAIVRHLGTP